MPVATTLRASSETRLSGTTGFTTRFPGRPQGDGIEIKVGSHSNGIRDNVNYNRSYPGILVYGTGSNPVNTVEGNVVWNSLERITAISDAIVRSNIVFNSGCGFCSYDSGYTAKKRYRDALQEAHTRSENVTNGTSWISHQVDLGKESHLGTRVADLDGDGDFDIVSIAWDNFQFLHVWRNDALVGTPPRDTIPPVAPTGLQVR